MSNLSFVELEQFYTEAIVILAELRDKKLLKKLPDDIASRACSLLDRYSKPEDEEVTVLAYDTRQHPTIPSGAFTSSELSDFWWKGNVEVKALFKGQKPVKCYCIANGTRLSFFAGAKKKPLKGQMVLSSAVIITMIPDGRRQGNMFTISEMAYEPVTLKFSSVDEGRTWYDAYHASQQVADVTSILSGGTDEGSGILYEALDDYFGTDQAVVAEDTVSRSDDVSCSNASAVDTDEERTESVTDYLLLADYSTSMSMAEEDSLKMRSGSRNSEEQRPDSRGSRNDSLMTDSSDPVEERDMAVLDEVPPESWGVFQHEHVYQTEWNFNLNKSVLPDQDLLSLHRGQLVLLKEEVNTDWWRVLDCNGNEGYIASCFLSIAYDL